MADAKKPLSGIRILELGPYVALPMTGRILASMGAEVIKVETNKVLDEMNFIPAWSRGGGQPEFQRAKKRVTYPSPKLPLANGDEIAGRHWWRIICLVL